VLLSRGISILLRKAIQSLFCISLFLFTCATPGLSQKTQPEGSTLPKYDLHTETKTKGVTDEVNLLSVGTRKDLTELIIKSVTRSTSTCAANGFKRRQASVTGSRVKQDASKVRASDYIGKGV